MTYPNLYHLKYLVDAVDLGSISSAARRNLISHSAVSQAIKSIEHNLGLEVMVHKKKSFEVTSEGYALVTKAKVLLNAIDSLAHGNLDLDIEIKGKVVFGISRSLAQAYLGALLTRIKSEYPDLQLEVKFGTTSELMEKTVQESVDVSLTIGRNTMPTLNQKLLRRGQFNLVGPDLKSREKDLPYILTEPKYESELFKRRYFEKFKVPLPVLLEVGSWDTIVQLVSEGHGYGLIPDIAVNLNKTFKVKKISTPWFECPCEIYYSEKKGNQKRALNSAIKSILQELVK